LEDILARLDAFGAPDAPDAPDAPGGLGEGEGGHIDTYMEAWLTQFDRTQALLAEAGYNEMHACGMGLCALLYKRASPVFASYDPGEEENDIIDKIFIEDCALQDMTSDQLQDIVTSVQLEFANLYAGGSDGPYECLIDLPRLMRCVMQRMGALLCNKFRSGKEGETEGLHQCVSVDEQGWCEVREEGVRALLLGIHVVLGTHRLLVGASYLPAYSEAPPEALTPRDFHREASLDEFYELDMVTTVPLGSIVQYRDKFRYLFHSISQVVYFHFPSYQRGRQASMLELESEGVPPKCILPLLLQIDPTTPVFYEHTGAGCRATHAAHAHSWLVLGAFVLLVDRNMASYCARDLRTLLRFKGVEGAEAQK
jgi:hypothetical protein